jgi:hypothetical protein
MTRTRRTARKQARAARGGHTVADHRPLHPDPDHPGHFLPVTCQVCRPPGKRWDRSLAGKAVQV